MLFRSPVFWIGFALVCWIFVLYSLQYSIRADSNFGEAASESVFLLFFFCFAAMLVAVDSGRRETVENTGSLRYTMPCAGYRWLLVKWVALLIPFTLLSWIPFFIYLSGMHSRLFEPGATVGLVYLAGFAIPMWFAVIAGYTIGERIQGRWSYVLAILIYMAFAYGIQIVLLGRLSSPLMLFNMLGHMSITDIEHFSLFWGFELGSLVWLHRLLFAAFTIVLAMWTGYRYGRRRRERSAIVCARIGAAAMAVMIAAASLYAAEAAQQRRSAERTSSTFTALDSSFLPSSHSESLLPDNYRIQLKVGSSGVLAISAHMDLSPSERNLAAGETIALFLDRSFSEIAVEVNGSDAKWSRIEDTDQLLIELPEPIENVMQIVFHYSGKIQKWMIGESSYGLPKVKRHTFSNSTHLRLPEDTFWYPVTSAQIEELTRIRKEREADERSGDQTPLRPSVSYELEVTSPVWMNVMASNLMDRSETIIDGRKLTSFKGQSRSPVMLIGGPFHVAQVQGERTNVTFVVSNLFRKEIAEETAQQTVRLLDRTADFIESTSTSHGLSFTLPERIVFVPNLRFSYPNLFVNKIVQDLLKMNTEENFESGWLQTNDWFQGNSQNYSPVLLWLWMEHSNHEHTLQAPMDQFFRMLREYVLAEPTAENPFTAQQQYRYLYDTIGKERFEQFIWEFYRFLQWLDAQTERRMNSSTNERLEIERETARTVYEYITRWRNGELP
jgi:hypothetical protein